MAKERNPEDLTPTAGSAGLRLFLARNRITQLAAATAVGVTPPNMSAWLAEYRRPNAKFRAAIEVWTKGAVPASAWQLETEAVKVARVRPFEPDSAPASSKMAVATVVDDYDAKAAG